jgi:CBS domain-containing protein
MYEFLEFRVDDFMTFPVVTIGPETTLAAAQHLFEEHDFNCLPVTDGRRLLGVLTKLDLLAAFSFTEGPMVPNYADILARSVSSAMTPEPITVASETPLTSVMQKFVATRVKSFPVLRGGEVVGIIAREDVVRALKCAAAGEGPKSFRTAGGRQKKPSLLEAVGHQLGCRPKQAEGLTLAVFQELRDRITPKEAADVAAQLPAPLKRLWLDQERKDRPVRRVHKEEFLGRVRRRAGLADDVEAERTVRAVFNGLQRALGSVTGKEGEAWDIFSQLPKDLKRLWLEASEKTAPACEIAMRS